MQGLRISVVSHPMLFSQPARTSRDVLREKPTWFLVAHHPDGRVGVGECSLIPGLSPEHPLRALRALEQVARSGTLDVDGVPENLPAVRFAVETALIDLLVPEQWMLFPSAFSQGGEGMEINGLVWMDGVEAMWEAAQRLVGQGFRTLKFKVGAQAWEEELALLRQVRRSFPEVVVRVDANGAFSALERTVTLERLGVLADLGLHSIEQPIRPGHWGDMAFLCQHSPLPIALDEELIGVTSRPVQEAMLRSIQPAFVVLKPSLLGGLREANGWIDVAQAAGAGWWATSALESNVGLNAIAQWTADALTEVPPGVRLPQGLGTGGLFTNNVPLPLRVEGGQLYRDGIHAPILGPWS